MKILIVITLLLGIHRVANADPTAEDLYAEGQAAYDRDDYATAIARWQASYQLSGESGLLFNLAQAHRRAGDCRAALATYRRFVAADPSADQHALAIDFIRELDSQCGPKPRVQASVPQVRSSEEPSLEPKLNLAVGLNEPKDVDVHPGRGLRVAGLAIGGGSLALIATGLYLGHHGQAIGDELTSACRSGCSWATWKTRDADGRRDVTIGHVLDTFGALGLVTGAVAYYLGVRDGALAITPRAQEDGAVVTWSGSW